MDSISLPSPFTRRETFKFHNSLLCLVKALENRYTTIDLRNETTVTGKITEVDGYMNVILSDATVFDTDGECQYFPILHVQARNIRNVHIPDNINIMKTIKSQILKNTDTIQTNKKLTFKQSRAKKQHQETLKLIEQMKKKKEEKSEEIK